MDSKRLLRWYGKNRRDLPWRRTRDPYAVWVSEVLLQQTRVDQAQGYYGRFLTQFPTLEILANAKLDAVLKAWESAGYYSRARNLHTAAKIAWKKYGRVPTRYEQLLELPGVGPYTAAAVSSIAFGEKHAVLDGNVIRVASRLLALKKPANSTISKKILLSFVQDNLPAGRAGDYNQALMELGATVCTPKNPTCGTCPLKTSCRAFQTKTQNKFPVKTAKPKKPHYDIACAVVRKGGRVLICQRKPQGLLGGLWEFPGGKVERNERLRASARREVFEETGVRVLVGKKIATVKHAYSHFRITLHAFDAVWEAGCPKPVGCAKTKWVKPAALERFAFPKANQRLLALILAQG